MSLSFDYIIKKYGEIIKEEVNVKDVKKIPESLEIKIIYKPIGKNISEKFGKDTGNIISLAKAGNVELLDEGKIKVFGNGGEWILGNQDYEIAYEGIDQHNMAVENSTIIKLDLNITPQLKKEGIIREISRFLNQLRKDAGYNVDDRINAFYYAENNDVIPLIEEFKEFLKSEALLLDISNKENQPGEISSDFESDLGIINFTLKK